MIIATPTNNLKESNLKQAMMSDAARDTITKAGMRYNVTLYPPPPSTREVNQIKDSSICPDAIIGTATKTPVMMALRTYDITIFMDLECAYR